MGLSHFFITYFTALEYTRMNHSFPGANPVFMSVGKAMLPKDMNLPKDNITTTIEEPSSTPAPEVAEPSSASAPGVEEPTSTDVLSGNKVGVEIEPVTKGNKVNVQLCNLSLVFSCFSREKKE
jgi:hypothetical protein